MPNDLKGAVVTDVDQDSAAYDAGIRPGSVIEEINHKPVGSADDAVKFTENLKSKKILLKLWSDGGSHYVVVDEPRQVELLPRRSEPAALPRKCVPGREGGSFSQHHNLEFLIHPPPHEHGAFKHD